MYFAQNVTKSATLYESGESVSDLRPPGLQNIHDPSQGRPPLGGGWAPPNGVQRRVHEHRNRVFGFARLATRPT